MKILSIMGTGDPEHGGPVEAAVKLGEIWESMGHHQTVATLDSPDASYLAHSPLDIVPLGNRRELIGGRDRRMLAARYGYTPRLVPWLKAHGGEYDVALVHSVFNYSIAGARRVLPGGALPYFHMPHGALDPWFGQAYPVKRIGYRLSWSLIEGPLTEGADAMLFTTEDERALAAEGFPLGRVRTEVVGLGTADVPGDAASQLAAFEAAYPQLTGRRLLLFLSRIHPKKGCDLLIEAFGRIASRHPDVDLMIAGPDQIGLRPGLEARARDLGCADRILWPGMIGGNVKWGAYRRAEAFVLPSHSENFGIVVAEAMACATPVLITDKVNIWREVKESGGGIVESDTVDGTIAMIERLLALPPAEHAAMRSRARAGFERYFEIETTARRLIDLFQRSVRSHRR